MGLLSDTFKVLAPRRATAVGATVPTWQSGVPQQQYQSNYNRFVLDGYQANEVVYACIEMKATSAAEPKLAAYIKTPRKPEQVENSPILDLWNNPNPFMDRFAFLASIVMYLDIAGNAYIEKVRSAAGQVVELWLLRPDRVKVIPDERTYLRGYQYQLGANTDFINPNDIIHIKKRNPYDDYYGLPPLAVAAARVDTDNFMRSFTAAFFLNAGVPSGLLNIMRTLQDEERSMIQQRFRSQYGGRNAHQLMVVDGDQVTYTQMGLPLGERGLVMPELNDIDESRIAMVFGVRPSLIGAHLSTKGSGLAGGTRTADSEAFWRETMIPIYKELAAAVTMGLVPEFSGVDYVDFDYGDVKALQEDKDALHKRAREDMLAGGISVEEFRVETGRDRDFNPKDTLSTQANIMREPVTPEEPTAEELAAEAAARQAALTGGQQGRLPAGRQPALNGATNGTH